VEPLATAIAVNPEFLVAAFYVIPVEQVFCPFLIAELIRVLRAPRPALAAKTELVLVSDTAIWTWNS
jgi:hypothetical protein